MSLPLTISLPDEVLSLIRAISVDESKSMAAYIKNLVKHDLVARGLVADDFSMYDLSKLQDTKATTKIEVSYNGC